MFPISEVSRMPTHELGMSRSNSSHSQQRLNDSDIPEIRVKTAYNGQVGLIIIIINRKSPFLFIISGVHHLH